MKENEQIGQDGEEHKKQIYQTYLEERKILLGHRQDHSNNLDKAILTLSAGALGLSLTYLDKISPHNSQCLKLILLLSWIGFTLSILLTLISFIVSEKAYNRQIEINDKYFDDEQKEPDKNELNIFVEFFRFASIISFMVGTVLLLAYTYTSMDHHKEIKVENAVQAETPGAKAGRISAPESTNTTSN